jgi:hypothetical protein
MPVQMPQQQKVAAEEERKVTWLVGKYHKGTYRLA